jgi:hypothetical protein
MKYIYNLENRLARRPCIQIIPSWRMIELARISEPMISAREVYITYKMVNVLELHVRAARC